MKSRKVRKVVKANKRVDKAIESGDISEESGIYGLNTQEAVTKKGKRILKRRDKAWGSGSKKSLEKTLENWNTKPYSPKASKGAIIKGGTLRRSPKHK